MLDIKEESQNPDLQKDLNHSFSTFKLQSRLQNQFFKKLTDIGRKFSFQQHSTTSFTQFS